MFEERMERLQFPQEAIEALKEAQKALLSLGEEKQMEQAVNHMLFAKGVHFHEIAKELSQKSGLPVPTVELLMQLQAMEPLEKNYKEKGLPAEIYWDTMMDLRYKLMECREVCGVWGTVAAEWQSGFFRLGMFQLGRLQYEPIGLPIDAYKGYKKGDTVYNLHIPSCGPMSPELVMDSLKRAYAFFGAAEKGGILPVHLHSWLIYPDHYAVYPEGGNLRKFYDLFDVFEPLEKPKNPYLWRIFGIEQCEDFASLPEKTSLQRRFKAYLLAGKCMGSARGMLLFDGEKIL